MSKGSRGVLVSSRTADQRVAGSNPAHDKAFQTITTLTKTAVTSKVFKLETRLDLKESSCSDLSNCVSYKGFWTKRHRETSHSTSYFDYNTYIGFVASKKGNGLLSKVH